MINFLSIFFSYSIKFFASRFIVYAKILQWFFNDSRILKTYLRRFTNNAPYINSDIDIDSISELKRKIKENGYSLTIDMIPINSGTISLVFKGEMENNGEKIKIAIKVLRKNIRQKINDAIYNLKIIIYLFSLFPIIGNNCIVDTFNDIEKILIDQSDLIKEVENIEYIEKISKKYNLSKPMKVYRNFSSDNFIIMQFMEGKTLFELNDEEKEKYALSFVKYHSFLLQKKMTVHLDLHPGNVLFFKENDIYKVTLLDMGMIKKFDVENVNFFVNMFFLVMKKCKIDNFIQFISNNRSLISDEYISDIFFDNLTKNTLEIQLNKSSHILKFLYYLIQEMKREKIKIKESFNVLLLNFISSVTFIDNFNILDNSFNPLFNFYERQNYMS